MRSALRGKSTSSVEVTHISQHGVWVLVEEEELFLPFKDFPWFREARVAEIQDVKLEAPGHLYWEALDVDLTVDIIKDPNRYPLISHG